MPAPPRTSPTHKFVGPTLLALCCLVPGIALDHAATSNTVLFDREIVRILNTRCVMCHMQGGPSFPLETYEETWLLRQAIHDQIIGRHMPPWSAVPGYGKFANSNELTLREQRFVVSWVEGLGPRNDGIVFLNVLDPAAAREPIRTRRPAGTWTLGAPDLEIALPAGSEASAAGAGARNVRRMTIDTGLAAEALVNALEYLPGDRSSIRAVAFTVEATGQWLATWTPWHGVRKLPAGSAYRLPAGTRIGVEIHTLETTEPSGDLGRLGLHLASDTTIATPADIVLDATGRLAAESPAQRMRAEAVLSTDTTLLALWPKLPDGIESVEVAARQPDGKVEVLLYALEVAADWPTPYIYETPVALPAGSRVSLTAYVSNETAEPVLAQVELVLSALE